jgi:NAD-dependent deacetylase
MGLIKMDDKIGQAANLIIESKRIVVFTGAGISTESGIPDFRSPGGVWSRYNQSDLTYQKFMAHEKYRKLYWDYDNARYPAMRDAQPNAAHQAIVKLEKAGKLSALITQNIDGLHQKAGNSPDFIYELHGTVHKVNCLGCGKQWSRKDIMKEIVENKVEVPYCDECGGPLKCATIAFGQSMPVQITEKAFQHARNCDLFITIGSSLVVQPANGLPIAAKQARAKLILINMSSTPFDSIMDIVINGKASETMNLITAALETSKTFKRDESD